MDIRDNGNSLYLKKLQTDSLDETIFRKAEEISAASYALDLSNPGAVSKLTKRIFFQMKDFYVSTALIPKSHGTVSMIILYSLDSVKHRILLQRLAFSGAAFLAILALSICSWFFTGRMITTPGKKSRQEQTEFIAAASHELRSPLAVILSGISAMKKADPKEQGERALLNFGHTLGHAVETLMDFSLLHGECVAIGCRLALKISRNRGMIY